MRIRVHSDVDRFTKGMDEAAKRQVPFALARALTKTAQDAQGDVRTELPRRFTIRNTWVSRGIRIKPATKSDPVAVVGSLEPFMAMQEKGGIKRSRGGHRMAPPPKKPKAIIPKSRRPTAVRAKKDVFVQRTKFGAGIFFRSSEERYPIVLLYWLKPRVKVKPAFGFKDTTETTVRGRFATNFVASLSQAMGHMG